LVALKFRERMVEGLVIQGSGVEILGERNLGRLFSADSGFELV
jgi:hypothetical protein